MEHKFIPPQHIRTMFNYSINKQQSEKCDLLCMAYNTFSTTKCDGTKIYLPYEIWEMIFDISHCVETCQTHLIFKKERIYNMDTYLTFSGTLKEFNHTARMMELDSLIFDERAPEDELPWEYHCEGACCSANDCPMNRGAVCSSIWKIMEFNTEKELKLYKFLIPRAYSFYGQYKINNFKTLRSLNGSEQGTNIFASQGDSHKSICGVSPSKGIQEICVYCNNLFYLSDKHHFDNDQQLLYCHWSCYSSANNM